MFGVIGLVCFWLFPDVFRSEGRRFAPYRAQLVVRGTSLERNPSEREFWLSGYITNTGSYPWRVGQLEVRFVEGASNVVDVRHADVAEAFVVQPHEERAFRVGLSRLVFTNRELVARVRVQTATDGNLAPKPNSD